MKEIEITEMHPEDAGVCIELIKQSVMELASVHYSEEQIEAWVSQYPSEEEFVSWRARRTMLVAREQDAIVGFGQIQYDRNEIVGVHVRPFRTRAGIGTRLVMSLEKKAKSAGLSVIVVQASLNAIEFYKACGYLPRRSVEFLFENDVSVEALHMEKKIEEPVRKA